MFAIAAEKKWEVIALDGKIGVPQREHRRGYARCSGPEF